MSLPPFGVAVPKPFKWVQDGKQVLPTPEEAARHLHALAMHGQSGMWTEEAHRWAHKKHDTAVEMLTGPRADTLINPGAFILDILMVKHEHGDSEY